MTSPGPGFIVLYRWRLHPGKEAAFITAWSRITALLRSERGSLGSRLHRGDDGFWYGYAQWPSDEVRQRAFANPVDLEGSRQMQEAVAERFPEVVLESVAGYLVWPPETAASRDLERCVPTLRVRDAAAACAYFCRQLGFEKDWEHRFEPGLPVYASVSRDGVAIHLSEHRGDGPLAVRIYVYVRDPAVLYDEVRSSGARIVSSLARQSYGTLEFVVEDLDGNHIRFGKVVAG